MKKYISAKIHGLTVTKSALGYHGSIGVDAHLLEAVGVQAYECVLVVNLSNGARWETYAIPAGPGEVELNGGSARLGCVGDRILVMAFAYEEKFSGAHVLMIEPGNTEAEMIRYEHDASVDLGR